MSCLERLCAASFGTVGLLFYGAAFGHDHWIDHSGYVGPDGVHCCGPNDCFEVPAAEIGISAEGYILRGYKEVVPYREAQASEDGKYWRCKRLDGSRRCFFAPSPDV